jgi:hypothetical protein
MVSLGCPKNLVDSERILTKLRADGYQMSADYQGADVVLINTCGFLDSARGKPGSDRRGDRGEWPRHAPVIRNCAAIVVLPVPGLPSTRKTRFFSSPPPSTSSSPAIPICASSSATTLIPLSQTLRSLPRPNRQSGVIRAR